ncbi:cation diffusion facilitator family transporter [Rivihabitans pingtungensis]|uniref:Cation diffusion facilitator family transporter n=1 Tax=Rivihabitans pingtungensis TaxID=1054498 RepID=A0A318L256_9NEIS|nr:cation diffusion facilitator family transporter [Rivihabitans pingtungensis]PXX82046.1 cation diffusion facilitator family transporter [Rivihabitans pingtungensis]HNX69819.1 cation diffusion facilitator family transporter [Rivihabitans pingtungensis]
MTHSHSFDPREETPNAARQAAAQRSTWVSVGVNIALSITQMLVGLWAGSQALVADAVHSLSDLVSDFVVLFANRHSAADADKNHPYGHGRFETAASLVIGVLLLSVGVGMLWSAAHKITDPASIGQVHSLALWVAGLALVSKELLFRYMLKIAESVKSSMLVANAWHARSDAASSLVVGVGVAGNLLGFAWLDPLAAALVGFMITHMGWKFSWSALSDLMDHSLDDEEQAAICATLEATPGVRSAHDLRTRRMGDLAMVDVHILVDGRISVSEGHYIAANARQRVLDAHRVLDVMVHIDPEDDSGHSRQMLALPHRAQVEDALAEVLDEHVRARISLELHYLNGVLELDAVLDPQACRDAAERERISRQLHALVGQVAGLSQVRIHHTLEASPSQPAALR